MDWIKASFPGTAGERGDSTCGCDREQGSGLTARANPLYTQLTCQRVMVILSPSVCGGGSRIFFVSHYVFIAQN